MGKIAVFDSGLGGLTVLSELKKLMPGEDYIYFGDSANAPYGDKTPDELEVLCKNVCLKLLEADEIKCFVIACNTTTAKILDRLERDFPTVPFVGIEPAVAEAAEHEPGKNILVLATTGTVNSDRLKERIDGLKDKAYFKALAAPGIVPYVEGFMPDRDSFRAYLKDLLKDHSRDTDAVVLGCTHFPFVKEELKECFDKDIRFYDAAGGVALRVKELLKSKGILKAGGNGSICFMNSDPDKIKLEERLLNEYK